MLFSDNIFKKLFLIISLFLFMSACNGIPGADARKFPANPEERVKKNLAEGKGVTFMDLAGQNGGGKFEFASSNPLWRASLDIIDFMPLATANYSGGIIVTDWYSEKQDTNESIKISIRFLTNEIRSDALDIKIFTRKCTSTLANCIFSESNENLSSEIKKEILKKAALYKKEIDSKKPESTYTYPVVDD